MPALWETAAALSLPVFPCLADKRPACPHGFLDAQTDRAAIRALFDRHPGELVGVPTGAVSGIDALDADTPRHQEAADWLRSIFLPATRVHQTQSGGRHYLFQHHPGLRNWTARPVPGIDGRADGGYVIWWAASGFAVHNAMPAPWPAYLLDLLQRPTPARREASNQEPINDSKLGGVLRRITFATNGERNDLLFWGACRVAEWIDAGELGRGVGERLLRHAADKAGLPPMEADRTILSALTHRDRHRG